MPFPLILLCAGHVDLIGYRLWPAAFTAAKKEDVADAGKMAGGAAATVIDHHVPLPSHTLPSRRRAIKVLAAGAALWALPFLLLVAFRGRGSLHTQEYIFFTQAALVTFGGAYAVLAYVRQAAAGQFGWITQA